MQAVGGALKNVQIRQAQEERRSEKLRTDAETSRTRLEGKTVQIPARAGAGDRLYGSITAQDIAGAIQKSLGVVVDKRKIQLKDSIKAMGTHTVAVKLHRDIAVPVTVEVVREAAA